MLGELAVRHSHCSLYKLTAIIVYFIIVSRARIYECVTTPRRSVDDTRRREGQKHCILNQETIVASYPSVFISVRSFHSTIE